MYDKIQAMKGGNKVAFQANTHFQPKAMSGMEQGKGSSFTDVMVNLAKETDRTLQKPDELMNRALTTGDVDVHEVMIANAKAEMVVNVAAQTVTKVIQAYERVQQIQV